MTVIKGNFNSKEVIEANRSQKKIYEAENLRISLWINQTPKMIDYGEAQFYLNLESLKFLMAELSKALADRQLELDELIEGMGE